MPSRRFRPFILIAIALSLLVIVPLSTGLLVDFWWYREIGFGVLFSRTLVTQLALFFGTLLVSGGLVYLNLTIAQRGYVPNAVQVQLRPGVSLPAIDVSAGLRRLTRPATIVLALVSALAATSLSDVVLQATHQHAFRATDPIFHRDIAYYVFTLPAISALLGTLSTLTGLVLIMLVIVYVFRRDVSMQPKRLVVEPSAGLHLAIVLALLYVLWALQLWFVDSSELLFGNTEPLVGAKYADIHALLPATQLSALAAVVAAVVILAGGIRRQLGLHAVLATAGYLIVSFLGRGIVPTILQKFVVAPTELTREEPYLAHHIAATRRAWGIDSVEVRDLGDAANLTQQNIKNNAATIENVRLWDREPLLRTFSQIQEIRTYYDFVSVDDDRYWVDGRYRQVLLAPRELNAAALPTRTFINEHLTFTHGMGLTLSPVNQVTSEGLPVLFVKDLPPSATGSLRVSRPQIYYGEVSNDFVFVNTKQKEFDYPAGDENVYRAYDGHGGVPVGNAFRRLIFAAHFGSSKIFLSGDIGDDSRILYNRNIVARAQKAFPFLRLDRDPYLVVNDDGTLVWIQDAYTTTDHYPYSYRASDGTSYMRNSVKIVIDAYHGSMIPYVSDPGDPLIQTWASIYPDVFKPMTAMPANLRAHIRYPDELFRAQTARYVTYHMNTPATFYNREDEWQVPVVTRENQAVPFMRHIIMRLPDEKTAEYIYMAPFTPKGKDNLAAWIVARNDGDNYGKLRVYRFPRQSLVFGPRQIENRINQDTDISREVSLWDQRGSQVIRGDLLVIPIDGSLLYVQPMYLQAEGGTIPELKRVVVAYQNQVIMRETLEAGLTAMFGGKMDARPTTVVAATDTGAVAGAAAAAIAGATGGATDAATRSLIAEAQRHYRAAIEAQRQGDWARYGDEIKQLGALLERLGSGRAPK